MPGPAHQEFTSCARDMESQWCRTRPLQSMQDVCGVPPMWVLWSLQAGRGQTCGEGGQGCALSQEQRARLCCLRPWQRSSLQPRLPQSLCGEPRPRAQGVLSPPGVSIAPTLHSLRTLSVFKSTGRPRGFLCGLHLSMFSTLKVKTEN